MLVLHPDWDLVSLQLYESWSAADYFMAGRGIDPANYLTDLVSAMASGWKVKFSQVPELGLPDQKISVPPEKLVIGLANSWSNPLPLGRKMEKWSESELKQSPAGRLSPETSKHLASDLRSLPNCANTNCPPTGAMPRFGPNGDLISGGGMNYRRRAGIINEKALALWPEEAGKAYKAMPQGAKCRGFMFWAISFEASAPAALGFVVDAHRPASTHRCPRRQGNTVGHADRSCTWQYMRSCRIDIGYQCEMKNGERA